MSQVGLFRRHLRDCLFREQGRGYRKCNCPVWCDVRVQGRRLLQSMQTLSWDRAQRKLDRMVDPEAPAREIRVSDAVADYLADCETRQLSPNTVRSYRKCLEHFAGFCAHEHYPTVPSITLEALTRFRAARTGRDNLRARPSTLRKEIEHLRAFFAFAVDRGWAPSNIAKKLRPPKESGPPTLPFEPDEVGRILNAADKIGNRDHPRMFEARRRMKTFILLLLYSGLRISDAAKLARSRLNHETGHLMLRQMKTGALLSVKLPDSLVSELVALPETGPHFFWTGRGKLSTKVGNLRATIQSVCQIAKINGHPHRFRDTFAVRLLEQDVPIRTVQLLLGHASVQTTEKHYGPFVRSQQRLLDAAVEKLDFSFRPLPQLALEKRVRNPKRNMRATA